MPSPSIVSAAAPQFARPGDTTAYAALDLIANSTTASAVVPLKFVLACSADFLQIDRAIMRKSSTGSTNPNFRLNLFSAIPTFATIGDNSAMSGNTTAATNFIGSLVAAAMTICADGGIATMFPSSATTLVAQPLLVDVRGMRNNGSVTLYGLLEALAAYAPGNAETFNVSIFARPML